ncbi:MAG TPA: CRISPR-associated endonuclease Cas3'' [Syntrophomonas sp.]|nr:CRISPR-associated endonuclease Cas3'' [Syntrophomonas sp.]
MLNEAPLAHSPRDGIPAQTYYDHVNNVTEQARENAQKATAYYKGETNGFIEWVESAAVYHDLGKLDCANQRVLQAGSRKPLPIAHDDAGVAELLKIGRQESAILAFGHHKGLFSRSEEQGKQRRPFRQLDIIASIGEKVANHVDNELENYERSHIATKCPIKGQLEHQTIHNNGFTRRIALSCLVDADHGDTARHYGNETEIPEVERRWKERLVALQHYVNNLPEGDTNQERNRNYLRKRLFEACRDTMITPSIRTCDAPVGSGKTTAIMAHLLRVASEHSPELRHIIIVLPFTNIITQSVEIYREALVLEGERPEDIVAEHHHRADFENLDLRQYATLWKAPIIVTTAVQFFETLASHHPARLRKLHELPGSAVFVDEMHAAIPSHLWPQMWRWLKTWTSDWGGHLVLASGSLARFWELDEYKDIILESDENSTIQVPDLVTDDVLRNDLKQTEERRITYKRRPKDADAFDCQSLIEFITKKPGPRLVVVNTVQTAAVIAQSMHKNGYDVLHLSTALAPIHRTIMVERIKQQLRCGTKDWTLVATTCVEAGMNFSFRTGFRECASAASLIQLGGRVSRGNEFSNAEVWDIYLQDDRFKCNSALSISRLALDDFSVNELNEMHPSQLATFAMKREWTQGADDKAKKILKDEKGMEYKAVSNACRVIDSDTRTVIIDKHLAKSIRKGKKVSKTDLINYSVQIWANKINKLGLLPIIQESYSSDASIYEWARDYDPDFLGYMKELLKLEELFRDGGGII